MRIGVLADVHGNSWALEAALAALRARGVDMTVNLGDHFWGCLNPRGAAQQLMALSGIHICGNQDRILYEPDAAAAASPDFAFLRAEITPSQMDWLRAQPASQLVTDGVLACHGTPSSDCTYLLETVDARGARLGTPQEIRARLGPAEYEVVLCGHSHQPGIVQVDGTLIVNPGSVGIPAYDDDTPYPHVMESGSPHARCAVVTRTRAGWQAELVAAPYPCEEPARLAERRGRPDRARWIRTGRA